tara:strand:+ start:5044 stop:5778 length:735 start_codon:yes stop_codon:yes gene_type:complete
MKFCLALIAALLPLNFLRILFYRTFLNYKISFSSKIGLFNIIISDKCFINNATIKNFNFIEVSNIQIDSNAEIRYFNRFSRLNKIHLKTQSLISRNNDFIGTRNGISPFKDFENFTLGQNSYILKHNIIDLSDSITIGNNVVLGGIGSQLWTHGFDNKRNKVQGPIKIGNNVYIGSSSMIMSSVNICDETIIGSGTVISKNIFEKGFYVSNELIQKKTNFAQKNKLIEFKGKMFLRKDNENNKS